MRICTQCHRNLFVADMHQWNGELQKICKDCNRENYLKNKTKKRKEAIKQQRERFQSQQPKVSSST